ncbi:glycosyltransferase family 2 protein [Patiriisocius marinus]|uniref:glycosyltransferase family 2 protein n=1 Tax=Patiriisocius marinus TaxID=1397112 RepID=UPI0023314EFB|nr:glycosyltransferase family 2 protein [Patiriisocius marinus]
MKISIVILNYNVRYFLEQCILTCQRAITNIDAEILIIDNNSPDDSCAMVKEKFPKLTLIENKENVGFSKANNQAVDVAKGEYVLILNPDTAITESSIREALIKAESLSNLGALGCYLMDGTGAFLPESKRNLPTPKVSVLKIAGFTKQYYTSHISEENEGMVSVLVGAYMLMKRSVYLEVGGFDEDYFMYGEDIDLSYKLTKAGYNNYYYGSVKTLHYKGESTTKNKEYLKRFYGAMNIFYNKHFQTNKLFDVFVQIGIKLASNSHRTVSEANMEYAGIQSSYVLTENLTLFGKISKVLPLELHASSKSMLQDSLYEKSLFVFDTEYLSYDQIFKAMTQLKGRGNIFRIRPPGCNFLLGSDRSDEKGSVTVF